MLSVRAAFTGGRSNTQRSFTKISHEKPSDTGGTTEHAREQPRTNENQQDKQNRKDSRNDEDKQSQKHKQKHTSQTPGKKAKTKPTSQKKERQEPNQQAKTHTSTTKEPSSATHKHTKGTNVPTHETRKPASRHQPPSQVSGAPPLRGEHLKGVELHGGGAELKPGLRPRPRRQVVTRNPNHLHPTDAVARKLAHNAHAKPPAVALRLLGYWHALYA